MYTLDATLQAALESGNYAPYFNAKIIDAASGTTLFEASTPPSGGGAVTGYKLNRLSLTITLQSSTFIDINYFLVKLQFSRGVTIGGQQYTLDTSDYFITDAFWDGNFQTFTCNLFPQTYYTADGALTYQEVIEAFCAYFGKTAAFLDDTADWLDYQFLPDGRSLTINNAQRFFTLLRQKHFIFATDNGNNEILFYAAWQNVEDPQYDIDAYGFDVNYHHQHRRQYLWRDENETIHRTETSFDLIQQLGTETYILSFADLGNGIVLAGTYSNGQIWRSTDYGLTWTSVLTSATPVYGLLNLGSGTIIAGTYGNGLNGRVYRSTDYGLTWTQIATIAQGIESMINLSTGIILAGTNFGNIYRSTNSGETWTFQSTLDSHIWSFAYCGNGIVLAGTEGGGEVHRSTDYGETWTLIQQLGTETKVLALLYLGNDIVLAGTNGGGQVYRSTDAGLTWSLIGQLDTELSVFHFDTFGYGYIIAETYPNAKLFKSTDAGLTWTLITNLGTETDIRAAIALTNGTFIAGTGPNGQIWRSENADAFLNSVHNLGFMPSTATEPTKYSQARAPVFAPFLVNLKYQSSDHITVNLLPTDATYKLLCADVTEELDLKQSRLPWRMTITDTQWLTNTEGGALPSTIEAAAPYTPLNTSKFANVLSEQDNNIQAAMETLDDHAHSNRWEPVKEAWTRTGNHTYTVIHDATTKYRKGTYVRYQDSAGGGVDEYGVISSSSYSAGTDKTTVNLIPNSDWAMASGTISNRYISYSRNPEGFPSQFNYAITWTSAASPQPALGDGTLEGKWIPTSHSTILVKARLIFGSTTTPGTGSWNLSIPVAPVDTPGGIPAIESAAGNALHGGLRYALAAFVRPVDMRGIYTNATLGAGSPFVWANTDVLNLSCEYEY